MDNPLGRQNIWYKLAFTEVNQRFEIVDEQFENEKPCSNNNKRRILSLLLNLIKWLFVVLSNL